VTPTRIALIGLGNHAYQTYYNSTRRAPTHELVAVCDVLPERIERFTRLYAVPRSYTDYREMLAAERLDAVLVQIGHAGNGGAIRAAIEAGVHVLVEKTPVATSAEADELVALQRSHGVHVMVGFNRRYMTSYVMAKEIAGRAEFGGVHLYHSQFHANAYDEAAFGINHVIHHLDLARWLLGEIEPTHVQRRVVGERREAWSVAFEAEAGTIGTIQATSTLDDAYPVERLELVGSGRNVVVDNVKSLVYNRPSRRRKDTLEPFALDEGGDALVWNPNHGLYPRHSHQGYENAIHAFVTALRGGTEPAPSLADARHSIALVERLAELAK
jgi:myo-inositol 2-dehydrogenase / D-chiro-inositol 1-dehydrogenase